MLWCRDRDLGEAPAPSQRAAKGTCYRWVLREPGQRGWSLPLKLQQGLAEGRRGPLSPAPREPLMGAQKLLLLPH